MIFTYKNLPHKLNKFHYFISHLVLEVWCKPYQPFDSDLLLPGFKQIVINRKDDKLIKSIKLIYNILRTKPKSVRRLLQDGFRKNNSIEALCSGNVTPVQYSEIKRIDKVLASELYSFFVGAYSLLDDSRVGKNIGEIKKRYKIFFSKGNNPAVCPFCGLCPLLNEFNSSREAYDHFFPKEIYPFNSVNFDNLVPMCHTCNSKYKTRKDPINIKNGGPRKRVLFPYLPAYTGVTIHFDFNASKAADLVPSDIDVSITGNGIDKELVSSWKYIFGIEERYRAKCCEEAAYKGWLEEYNMSKYLGSTLSFDDYIKSKSNNTHLNVKFLEIAYLVACKKAAMIS